MNIIRNDAKGKTPFEVTAEEAQLLRHFRQGSDKERAFLTNYLIHFMADKPAQKPALRVVGGAA